MLKKIGFLGLGCLCLLLAGCFHIPDEDWIFTKDSLKVNERISSEESEFINSVNQLVDTFKTEDESESTNEVNGDIDKISEDENNTQE